VYALNIFTGTDGLQAAASPAIPTKMSWVHLQTYPISTRFSSKLSSLVCTRKVVQVRDHKTLQRIFFAHSTKVWYSERSTAVQTFRLQLRKAILLPVLPSTDSACLVHCGIATIECLECISIYNGTQRG